MKILDEFPTKEIFITCPNCGTKLSFTVNDLLPDLNSRWLEFYDNYIICICCNFNIKIEDAILRYLNLITMRFIFLDNRCLIKFLKY